MNKSCCPLLQELLEHLKNNSDFRSLLTQLKSNVLTNNQLLALYTEALTRIEERLWNSVQGANQLHRLYLEKEALHSNLQTDNRHDFAIIIPVTDQPQQLSDCLGSLLIQCRKYKYGGMESGRFKKVSVIIADDSKESGNISQHRKLAEYFTHQGLVTDYFGLDEQLAEIAKLNSIERKKLANIVGNVHEPPFHHKGAAIMRNITYLKLNQATYLNPRTLFWFVDCDLLFQSETDDNPGQPFSLNHFHYLDRIFSSSDINILSGEVIGDIQVSPAVCVNQVLDDVLSFLGRTGQQAPDTSCSLQHNPKNHFLSPVFHDLAEAFGFERQTDHSEYQCQLHNKHNHIDSLRQFSDQLNQLFHGMHPTRQCGFRLNGALPSTRVARCLNTSHYLMRFNALKHFIPFADLNLGMRGPALGVLLQAEIKDQFAYANLPIRRRCTTKKDLVRNEIEPEMNGKTLHADLSTHQMHQYLGDVMLLSLIKMANNGFPEEVPDREEIYILVKAAEQELEQEYLRYWQSTIEHTDRIKALLDDKSKWWNQTRETDQAMQLINHFINTVVLNFSHLSKARLQIKNRDWKRSQLKRITHAIADYHIDKTAWVKALSH